jgi:integrase
MKTATKDGLGLKKRRAEFIPVDLEEQLWEDGHLGIDSPKKLLATILYLIGIHFGLRARKEHRQLRFGNNSQFQILGDHVTKQSVLRYTEDCQKTRNGGLHERNIEPKVIDRYETDNPHNIVKVFKCYVSHRPTTGKNVENFYLQPLENPRQLDIGFKDQAVGENKIGKMIKVMFEEAGINGHFTNHSLRRSKVTRMFQSGAEKMKLCEKQAIGAMLEFLHIENFLVQRK